MKRWALVLILTASWSTGGFDLAGHDAWGQAAKPVTIRLGSSYPSNIVPSQFTLRWQEQVTKTTNGRIKFENLWLGSFCKAEECVGHAEKGLVDMIGSTWLYYPKQMPLNQWNYAIPFGPEDPRVMLKIGLEMWKRYPALKEEIEKNNLKILRAYSATTYNLISKKPVRTVEDLKGMKIGAGGTYLPLWVKAAGAAPVAVTVADRYNAMQTGVIDGSLLPVDNHDSLNLVEVGKFVTQINLGSNFLGYWAMNKNSFNRFSLDDQKMLITTAEQASMEEMQYIWEEQPKMLARWKGKGATIIDFPDSEKKKWAALLPEDPFQSLAKKMGEFRVNGTEFVKAYIALCKENGHEFPMLSK
jgi:TRAP-type C4-dicarboxylate transport system substrate-binding protein